MPNRPLRIGLTYNLRANFPWRPGAPRDADADWDIPETVSHLARGITDSGHEVVDLGDPGRLIDPGVRAAIDLVFSICEMQGGSFREALVPALCETLGLPYALSAPDTLVCCLDKHVCNLVVREAGVAVPSWHVIDGRRPPLDTSRVSTYPCLVKPVAEGSGMGVHVAGDGHELIRCVEFVSRQYDQPALVQTYLSGREFTVGVLENNGRTEAMGVLEIVPSLVTPHFVYDVGVKERADELVAFRPLADRELAAALGAIAERVCAVMRCRDCARVDIRLDDKSHPFFLEVNPLPHLHPAIGDFCRSATAAGYSYPALLQRIIASASARWGL